MATAAVFSLSTLVYSNNKLRQQIVVRMGNESVSRFHDGLQWASLSKKGCKEVIQSKSTREVVEKYTLEHVDPEEVKREGLIYQWRTQKKAARFTVEIYEMKYVNGEDGSNCFLSACQRPEALNHKLVVYTEHIHKLYQNSIRFLFPERDQFRLFAEILHAIEQLSQKFGYFMVSKEMIGYNSKMTGKVWINENFASNFVQFKRQIHTKGDREKWQASIIQNIIDICRLCTTQVNAKSNKFQHVISQIRDNRLFSFSLFERFMRSMGYEVESLPRDSLSLQKRMSSQDKSRKVGSNECSSKMQILNSNGKQSIKQVNSSTKDCKDTKLVKEKRFVMVPVVNIKKVYPVTEQQRQYIDDVRNSSRYSHEVRQNSLIASPLRQNYVDVERQTQSYIKKSHQIYKIKSEISKPLDSILEIPLKSAQINDMSDIMRDSSLLSSPHEQILMVDSMIVVQNQRQSEQLVRKNTKFILEESVILRGQE